jgi:hypothetical protein
MTGAACPAWPELTRATSNPLHALDAAAPGARRNTARAQRDRVLARLQAGPVTAAELARACYCPSPTKRVSELRRRGWPIRSAWIECREPDGSVSPATVYSLPADTDPAQLHLFPA